MKTIVKILLFTVPIATQADTQNFGNGNSDLYGYKATEGCYGPGCLPTAILQEVLKQPSYYTKERIQNEKLIYAIEESNEINREWLQLDLDNHEQE